MHFLAMASRTMRRVLIDNAKGRAREERGGGVAVTLPSDVAAASAPASLDDLLALVRHAPAAVHLHIRGAGGI